MASCRITESPTNSRVRASSTRGSKPNALSSPPPAAHAGSGSGAPPPRATISAIRLSNTSRRLSESGGRPRAHATDEHSATRSRMLGSDRRIRRYMLTALRKTGRANDSLSSFIELTALIAGEDGRRSARVRRELAYYRRPV
eukprot:2954767-Prymnesium_polylepis.2